MSHSSIGTRGMAALGAALADGTLRNLEALFLDKNRLGPLDGTALAHALSGAACGLARLREVDCRWQAGEGMGAQSAAALRAVHVARGGALTLCV